MNWRGSAIYLLEDTLQTVAEMCCMFRDVRSVRALIAATGSKTREPFSHLMYNHRIGTNELQKGAKWVSFS